MWELNEVTSIQYREGYVFHVTFDDGMEADVDLSEYVGKGPVFEPLRDVSYFRKARIEGGTIAWPDGADIAPETLYEKVESASKRYRTRNSGQAILVRRQATRTETALGLPWDFRPASSAAAVAIMSCGGMGDLPVRTIFLTASMTASPPSD